MQLTEFPNLFLGLYLSGLLNHYVSMCKKLSSLSYCQVDPLFKKHPVYIDSPYALTTLC